jgi:hypothetical protein
VTDIGDTAQPPQHPDDRPRTPLRRHLTEAGVGLVVALLLLWTAIASATDVPFVYQGL